MKHRDPPSDSDVTLAEFSAAELRDADLRLFPKIVFVTCVYAAQGVVPGLSLNALVDFYSNQGLPLSRTATMYFWIGVPWMLSFVWGPVIDNVTLGRLPRRGGWLLATGVAGTAALGLLATVSDATVSLPWITGVLVIHSVAASIIDATTDALVIEMTSENDIPRLHAWGRGGFVGGTALSALVTAGMLPRYDFRIVAAMVVAAWVAALLVAAAVYRVGWEGVADPDDEDTGGYIGELRRRLLSRRSVVTAGAVAAAFGAYTVLKLAANFYLAEAADGLFENGVATFTQLRSGINLAMTAAIVVLASKLFPRLTLGRQTWVTAAAAAVMAVVGGVVIAGWISVTSTVVFSSLTEGIRLLLYLTACRHFATLSVPLTAGAQFTTYMALINASDIVSARLAGWWTG